MARGDKLIKYKEKPRIKHPGVHAKSKMSVNKRSKHYIKLNVGQGK